MAALVTASTNPTLPPADFLALVEQRRHEMVLPTVDEIPCVFCSCGEQRWGVRLSDVQRIIPQFAEKPVAIPNSPPWVAGFLRVEADFATLIDTARFLGGPPTLPQRPQRDHAILVIAQEDALLGLFVTQLSLAAIIQATEWQPGTTADAQWPYFLARYAPMGEPVAGTAGALGFLDVRRVAQACLAELAGEGSAHDPF